MHNRLVDPCPSGGCRADAGSKLATRSSYVQTAPDPVGENSAACIRRSRPVKSFLLVLLGLSLALGGCLPFDPIRTSLSKTGVASQSTPNSVLDPGSKNVSSPNSGWDKYVDPAFGFQISYPSDWYVYTSTPHQNPGTDVFVVFSSALGNTSTQGHTEDEKARLVVTVVPNEDWRSVDEWLDGSPLLSYTVARRSFLGLDGLEVTIPNGSEGDGRWLNFVFLLASNKGFVLEGAVSLGESEDGNIGLIKQMQESFEVAQ